MGTETEDVQLQIDIIGGVADNFNVRLDKGTLQWMLTLGKGNKEPDLRLAAAQGILLIVRKSREWYVWSANQLPFVLADGRDSLTAIEWLRDMASKDPAPNVKDRALRLLGQFAEFLHNNQFDKDPNFSRALIELREFLSSHPSVDDAQGSE